MSKSEILADLSLRVLKAGSVKEYAKSIGFSPSYISDVMRVKRPPSDRLLTALGYARQIVKAETKPYDTSHLERGNF